MNSLCQFMFFKIWATYLKTGQLSDVLTVLKHLPKNPSQLAFLLEISTQLCILKYFDSATKTLIYSKSSFPLAKCIESQQIKTNLTAQNIQKIISIYLSMSKMYADFENKKSLNQLFIPILQILINSNQVNFKSKIFKYFLSLGKYIYLEMNSQKKQNGDILNRYKQLWSVRKIFQTRSNHSLIDLLLIWSINQAESYYQLIGILQNISTGEEQGHIFLCQWFEGIAEQIVLYFNRQSFQKNDLIRIISEAKFFAQRYRVKDHKVKKSALQQIKNIIFQISKEKLTPIHFGCCFTILSTLCNQLQEKIQTIVRLQDLVENELALYAFFWQLSERDYLFYFPSFSAYMREHSQYSILQIYQKIDPNLKVTTDMTYLQRNTIQDLIIKKQKTLFEQFNIQPIRLSIAILQSYLQHSGVSLPKKQKIYPGKNMRKYVINPIVPDPLHFIMIASKFWEDSYHRGVLEIALWVTLHFYCNWLSAQKFKETNQKQTQDYIKKLNLTISVFLLSLNHPTRILQYLPVQSDCLKDLFVQEIFPTMVLNSKYFFKSYHWDSSNVGQKIDVGLESWVLPWAHLLANPKTMLHFIYLEKGYELAYILATQNKVNFQRVYGDFFISRILTQLQGVGINLLNLQAQNKQKSYLIHPQRKRYMILLLKQNEKSTEKYSQTARKILQILA